MKILILGGYGTFGGRLARLLADEAALTLFIAGRSHDKAAAFCADLHGAATFLPLAFDREGDVDGPFIPSLAAEAIIRRCLEGRPPPAGARAGVADLELADYEPLFGQHAIFHGFRETASAANAPLYHRILGEAWSALPEPLRAMHDLKSRMAAEGVAAVERGRGLLARLIAALFGFPKAGRDLPVRVAFERRGRRELWRRTFAGRSFVSRQYEGRGRSDRLLVERFGPFAFAIAALVGDGRLRLVVRRWSVLGLPLPLWLAPAGEAYEYVADGRFHFHVELGHRLTGLIVRYRGWLAPPAESRSPP